MPRNTKKKFPSSPKQTKNSKQYQTNQKMPNKTSFLIDPNNALQNQTTVS